MRRGLLVGILGTVAVCLLVCVGGGFLIVNGIRGAVQEGLESAFATEIAQVIPAAPGETPPPGSYTLTEQSIQQRLGLELDEANVEDILVRILPTRFEFGFATGGQEAIYSGTPVAENGRLQIRNMESSHAGLNFVVPADRIGAAMEDAVNGYLDEHGLVLQDVELRDGEIVFDVGS